MKNLLRFLIPIGLGVVAFVLNMMAVGRQLGDPYVTVKQDVEAGVPLTEEMLESVKLPSGDAARLQKILVPWNDRASLLGLPPKRLLASGDLVFWQDIDFITSDFDRSGTETPLHLSLDDVDFEPSLLKVGDWVGLVVRAAPTSDSADAGARYRELGPFRILSIGKRTVTVPNGVGERVPSEEKLLTLAVPKGDESGQLSQAANDLLAARDSAGASGKKFAALFLHGDPEKQRKMAEWRKTFAKPAETN